MENRKTTLVIFTGEFPYGRKGEPFLEDEIFYQAEEFDEIIVVPRKKDSYIRKLPGNVTISDVLNKQVPRIRQWSFACLLSAVGFVIKQSFNNRFGFKYFFKFKYFLFVYLESLFLKTKIEQFIIDNKIDKTKTIFYCYWSDTTLLACSFLKRKGVIKKLISRVHGFDLYNNRSPGGIQAFRNVKFKNCNKIFAISLHGKEYLKHQLKKRDYAKIEVAYLGVKSSENKPIAKINDQPLIVSCARMEEFKRISWIPEILSKLDFPVEWVHFGDGKEYKAVEEMVSKLPKHIKVSLMGQRENYEIHEFYKQNKVNLFLSLSTSEGLPVSMMEAISYGIPIVATSINGVPEIVNSVTGVRLDIDASKDEIITQIVKVIKQNTFNEDDIISFYHKHFDADVNYAKFAKELVLILNGVD